MHSRPRFVDLVSRTSELRSHDLMRQLSEENLPFHWETERDGKFKDEMGLASWTCILGFTGRSFIPVRITRRSWPASHCLLKTATLISATGTLRLILAATAHIRFSHILALVALSAWMLRVKRTDIPARRVPLEISRILKAHLGSFERGIYITIYYTCSTQINPECVHIRCYKLKHTQWNQQKTNKSFAIIRVVEMKPQDLNWVHCIILMARYTQHRVK